MSLADIVRIKPAEEEKKEQSEFNDKIVRDYRIIKPIGKLYKKIIIGRRGKILCGVQGLEDIWWHIGRS